MVAADGYSYERSAIQKWFRKQIDAKKEVTSPSTNQVLEDTRLIPNHQLKSICVDWLNGIRSKERIDRLRLKIMDANSAQDITDALVNMQAIVQSSGREMVVLGRETIERLRVWIQSCNLLSDNVSEALSTLSKANSEQEELLTLIYREKKACCEDCIQAQRELLGKHDRAQEELKKLEAELQKPEAGGDRPGEGQPCEGVSQADEGLGGTHSDPIVDSAEIGTIRDAKLSIAAFAKQAEILEETKNLFLSKMKAVSARLGINTLAPFERKRKASHSTSSDDGVYKKRLRSNGGSKGIAKESNSSTSSISIFGSGIHKSSSNPEDHIPINHVPGKELFELGWEHFCDSEFKYINKPKGIALMSASACLNYPMAVASCSYYGWGGFPINQNKACQMFHDIIKEDGTNHYALYSIGSCYYFGIGGVQQSYATAYEYLTRAKAHGNTDHPYAYFVPKVPGQAEFERGWMLCSGVSCLERNIERGRRIILESASKFNFPLSVIICNCFGWPIVSGDAADSSATSTSTALSDLDDTSYQSLVAQISAVANSKATFHHYAQLMLGMISWKQAVKSKSKEAGPDAFANFSGAASVGNALGMGWLADCYRDGIGVESDPAKAEEWCEKARQAGFNGAGQEQFSCGSFFASMTGRD